MPEERLPEPTMALMPVSTPVSSAEPSRDEILAVFRQHLGWLITASENHSPTTIMLLTTSCGRNIHRFTEHMRMHIPTWDHELPTICVQYREDSRTMVVAFKIKLTVCEDIIEFVQCQWHDSLGAGTEFIQELQRAFRRYDDREELYFKRIRTRLESHSNNAPQPEAQSQITVAQLRPGLQWPLLIFRETVTTASQS